MNTNTFLNVRLDRVVQSAALTAGCESSILFVRYDTDLILARSYFGKAPEPCDSDQFETLLAAINQTDQGILLVEDMTDPVADLCQFLPRWDSQAARFAVLIAIKDHDGQARGLLAICDPKPKPGLSPAKIYVLLSLAFQIADSLMLHRLQTNGESGFQGNERLRLLESVVVHAKDAILITEAEPIDLPGPRIVYCNAAFTETTGYSAEDVIGQTPRILQGVGSDPQCRAKIRASLAQWKPIEIEMLNYKKDGEPFWVELSIVPVADEKGWYTHWVSVQRDVTDRKAAHEVKTRARMAEASNEALLVLTNDLRVALEAAEAANVAKSQFLANMSHEIRTPLNGVLGMTQALWADDLTPTQRERVTIIRESGQSLLAVLNDVLDLSKIEAGKMELEFALFDPEEVAKGVCGAFTEQANRNGLSFGLTVSAAAGGRWLGDSVRLKQILYNLISNALKFTAVGEVKVSLDINAEGHLVLTVQDTGIGIADDKVKALFSKFYQADSSMTRRFGGTGLGLSICRQLCELMGGSITVTSTIDRGSTFTVELPLEHAPNLGTAAQETSDEPGAMPSHLGRLRVLAAEDNRTNQLVLRALLQAFDITPVIVEHGGLAVEAWKNAPFDVILMDIQMPEMDGVTATRTIRAEEVSRGLSPIPIIAVSANAMKHQIAEYLAAGMSGHLAKPLDIALLAEALSLIEAALEIGLAAYVDPAFLKDGLYDREAEAVFG